MTFTITTGYENINQEWLDWYLERLASQDVMPGSTGVVDSIKKLGRASFTSKDPISEVVGTTQYVLVSP